jgi:nucleoside-diphosphate-sugar epimerase
VENCADCLAEAAINPRALGQTFNVVDPEPVSAWQFASAITRIHPDVRAIPVPYAVARHGVRAVYTSARRAGRVRLPSLLVPRRFDARFGPAAVDASRVFAVLNWRPLYGFAEAVRKIHAKQDAWPR